MADGRMLSKRVTRSGKVSSLSSDTARMIYSWLIPYTDVEGRMEADPRLLKADIAPLLDHVTPEVINRVLLELHEIGLVILYSCSDGSKQYLQITKFEDNQKNLRKDREAASRIPSPSSEQVRRYSGEGPAEVLPNIREEKLREANTRAEEVDESSPVDNFQEGASIKTDQDDGGDEIKKAVRFIQEKKGPYYAQQVMIFLQAYLRNGNRRAVVHCLRQVVKGIDDIAHPKAYLEAAFKIENGKHNAEDHNAAAQEYKKPVTKGELNALASILKGMGAPS
jgi:hypothetical protein